MRRCVAKFHPNTQNSLDSEILERRLAMPSDYGCKCEDARYRPALRTGLGGKDEGWDQQTHLDRIQGKAGLKVEPLASALAFPRVRCLPVSNSLVSGAPRQARSSSRTGLEKAPLADFPGEPFLELQPLAPSKPIGWRGYFFKADHCDSCAVHAPRLVPAPVSDEKGPYLDGAHM